MQRDSRGFLRRSYKSAVIATLTGFLLECCSHSPTLKIKNQSLLAKFRNGESALLFCTAPAAIIASKILQLRVSAWRTLKIKNQYLTSVESKSQAGVVLVATAASRRHISL